MFNIMSVWIKSLRLCSLRKVADFIMSIKVEHITKNYGKHAVLKDISFDVEEGTMLGLTGRNGCGKTTLLSILAGVERAGSGRIVYTNGKLNIGYLPQINPLMEDMSVADNLKLWVGSRKRMEELLTEYDLSAIKSKRVSRLSGGMKRRLSIACAMADNPKLLIMDEPTAALDVVYKEIIHNEMREYVKAGGTIIMVTHEKEEIDMCNRCYMIENGQIVS